MALKDTDLNIGDRVRSIKWGKLTDGDYVGLEGKVVEIRNDLIRVKLDADPVAGADNCPFYASELELVK